MTSFNETGSNRWFSVYVPHAESGATTTTYETYFRLGGPNTVGEVVFVNALRAAYADAAAEPAVQAAFGVTPTGGAVLYTEGDLLQFVNGRADTRVLNDSYVVHVLNKADAQPADGSVSKKAYRSYLRLGKPNDDIERQLQGVASDPDELLAFVLALVSTAGLPLDAATTAALSESALNGDLDARNLLLGAATNGDPGALAALDELRKSADPRANVVYDGQTTSAWALSSLQALHLKFANARRDEALYGVVAARTLLAAQAGAGDPVARHKLVELAESITAPAATSYQGQPPARDWAKEALAALPPGEEMLARWSLGDGVALYSDRPVTVTTPAALKVTVGSDSRTVLGPTYSETYDVSDDVIQQIRDGRITQPTQIGSKRLITASLTAREASRASWRTTKFDQSKALTYSLSDLGTFAISSSYTSTMGLKLSNGISGSFDGSVGVSVSVPASLKLELGKKRLETSWTGGKINYSSEQELKGSSVKLGLGTVVDFAVAPAREKLVLGLRVGMIAINGLILAYTATAAGIANRKSKDGEDSTKDMREFLESGEACYIAIASLNALLMAAGLVVGIMQLMAKKAVDAAELVSPAQTPNLLINKGGIKLQCGASYLHIDATGIALYGPQIYVAGPLTNVLPTYLTGNMSPTAIAEAEAYAAEQADWLEAFLSMGL